MFIIIYRHFETGEEFKGDNEYYTESSATDVLLEMRKLSMNAFGDHTMIGYPIRVERK